MADITAPPRTDLVALSTRRRFGLKLVARRRLGLFLLAVLSALAGVLITGAPASAAAEAQLGADLARMLKVMAALKVLMALPLIAAIAWRLALPIRAPWALGYGFGVAAIAAGPGLVWDMVHILAGSVLTHMGLLGLVLLLLLDPAVGQRLQARLDARRARFR